MTDEQSWWEGVQAAIAEREAVREAALNLWTWLPSYSPRSRLPAVADVIREASDVLAKARERELRRDDDGADE